MMRGKKKSSTRITGTRCKCQKRSGRIFLLTGAGVQSLFTHTFFLAIIWRGCYPFGLVINLFDGEISLGVHQNTGREWQVSGSKNFAF